METPTQTASRDAPDGPRKAAAGPGTPIDRGCRWLVVVLLLLAAGGLLYGTRPGPDSPPLCLFHRLTGWFCPGCGGSRAVWLLAHGAPLQALRYHAPLVLALPWLAVVLLRRHRARALGDEPARRPAPRWVTPLVLTGLGLFWLLRNLPWWPCTLLAPPTGPLG